MWKTVQLLVTIQLVSNPLSFELCTLLCIFGRGWQREGRQWGQELTFLAKSLGLLLPKWASRGPSMVHDLQCLFPARHIFFVWVDLPIFHLQDRSVTAGCLSEFSGHLHRLSKYCLSGLETWRCMGTGWTFSHLSHVRTQGEIIENLYQAWPTNLLCLLGYSRSIKKGDKVQMEAGQW